MKLYLSPGACSLSPHIVSLEAGVPLELKKVDLKSKQISGGGSFTAVNPKGSVPALQLDDGEVLTEGPAIVQFLADRRPQTQLLPPVGSLDRYRVLEWLNYISSEIHKAFSPLFNPAAAADSKSAAVATLKLRLDFLERKLAGRAYLLGDRFTVADAYLFTVLNWTQYVGIDLQSHPAVAAYVARVAARPMVQAAMKAEAALG